MSRTQRAGLLALAAVALGVAVVVLQPDDDGARREATTATTPPPPAGAPAPAPTPAPAPDHGPLLAAGRVRTITVERGDQVRFRVRSSTPEELHVHGYDLVREVPAGRTVRVSFKADIEGIFEIELHRSGAVVARLRVEP
jgi:hypothetical protein